MEYLCGHCTDTVPHPDLLYKVDWWEESVCGACKHAKEVEAARVLQEAEAAAQEAAVEGTWQSEVGKMLRARRNALLDARRWTIMPDSRLTAANQVEWLAYLHALQDLTVTYPDLNAFMDGEGQWKWPVEPAEQYEPRQQQA